MGEHGYAIPNVLTDSASLPAVAITPEAFMDAMQHKADDWNSDCSQQIVFREFQFEDYLGGFA